MGSRNLNWENASIRLINDWCEMAWSEPNLGKWPCTLEENKQSKRWGASIPLWLSLSSCIQVPAVSSCSRLPFMMDYDDLWSKLFPSYVATVMMFIIEIESKPGHHLQKWFYKGAREIQCRNNEFSITGVPVTVYLENSPFRKKNHGIILHL